MRNEKTGRFKERGERAISGYGNLREA